MFSLVSVLSLLHRQCVSDHLPCTTRPQGQGLQYFFFNKHLSANFLSIWRLACIIRTRATTYPCFDPTWYGATPIVLATLEVDVAVVCAALPVFWPVLCNMHLNQILVTREVKVTLEDRRRSTEGAMARASNDQGDDSIELGRSESGLQRKTSRRDHYEDPYVAHQVNPFSKAEYGVTFAIDGLPSERVSSDRGLGKRGTVQEAFHLIMS